MKTSSSPFCRFNVIVDNFGPETAVPPVLKAVAASGAVDSRGLIIAVENTGPGIPDQDRGKVFERFYRADRARSRGVDGFGLGLSLARAVIEGHGGEIRLVRADGEWTRFEVVLPA